MADSIKSVVINGFKNEYFTFGSGKKAMVVIPGLNIKSIMLSKPVIENQYKVFKDEYTVYVLERRDGISSPYSPFDIASDTIEIFEQLGLKDIYLFGSSLGGMISFIISSKRPDLIKKVAVAGTSLDFHGNGSSVIRLWVEKARQRKGSELYDEFGKYIYPESFYNKYKDALVEIGKTVTEKEFDKFAYLAEGSIDMDISSCVKDIICPVCAFASDDDKVFGQKAIKDIEQAFVNNHNFKSVNLAGYGHALCDTYPGFSSALLEFFNDQEK